MTREAVEERKKMELDDTEVVALQAFKEAAQRSPDPLNPLWTARPQPFEKDCDEHIDFVTAAAVSRQTMFDCNTHLEKYSSISLFYGEIEILELRCSLQIESIA